MIATQQLDALEPQQMRQTLLALMAEVAAKDELLARRDREVAFKQALIDKLTRSGTCGSGLPGGVCFLPNGRSNSMKPSSQRLTPKPKKGASRAATAATLAENTLATASGKTHGIPGKKAVKAKTPASEKRERQAGVAFACSSVMAHDAVMKGVSGRALTRIWESTRGTLPTDAILKAIGVSARTAHRLKTDPDKLLDARTTDGIYRFESVRAMAEEVLGSAEAANEWLNTEAMGLEFRKPIDLVSTSPGAEAVKTLLQRMKYGVYA